MRIQEEHGYSGGYTTVKDYVRGKRFLRYREIFVPLSHPSGHAQADFVEALAVMVELISGVFYNTRQEAKTGIFEYIEVFYSRQRRYSYLGYLSPVDFEKKNVA
jgi:transposase InsO family protein